MGNSFVLFDVSIVISRGYSFTVGTEVTYKTCTPLGLSPTFPWAKGQVERQLMCRKVLRTQIITTEMFENISNLMGKNIHLAAYQALSNFKAHGNLSNKGHTRKRGGKGGSCARFKAIKNDK